MVRENAGEVGMALKADTDHIEGFALEPICRLINGGRRGNRPAFGNADLDSNPLLPIKRIEMIDGLERLIPIG